MLLSSCSHLPLTQSVTVLASELYMLGTKVKWNSVKGVFIQCLEIWQLPVSCIQMVPQSGETIEQTNLILSIRSLTWQHFASFSVATEQHVHQSSLFLSFFKIWAIRNMVKCVISSLNTSSEVSSHACDRPPKHATLCVSYQCTYLRKNKQCCLYCLFIKTKDKQK